MGTTSRPATEEDLLRTPDDENIYELVDGEIRAGPRGGHRHSRVCVNLLCRLARVVDEGRLGELFGPNTGFRLPGGNVRAPDGTFVARGRFPDGAVPEGFCDLAPDLAVEVLCADDRPAAVLDKVGEYLQAGVRLVWVIDPNGPAAVVYKSPTDVRSLGPDDFLDGEDVVPGFRCRLADVID
jgi:Uma2 family endonuclease